MKPTLFALSFGLFLLLNLPAICLSSPLVGVLPLEGTNNCDYAGPVTIGGQEFWMIMDTGSTVMAVATPTCCGDLVSATYQGPMENSQVSDNYGSGYWKGLVARGEVSMGGIGPFETVFAGMTEQAHLVGTCAVNGIQANMQGILGLGYPSSSRPKSILDIMCENGMPNGFAIQLCGYQPVPNKKTGMMWLGGYSTKWTTGDMQYAKIVAKSLYSVNVIGFSVGGQAFTGMSNINSPKSIVDTGTTDVIFNSLANYNAFLNGLYNSDIVIGLTSDAQKQSFWYSGTCESVTLNLAHPLEITLESDTGGVTTIPFPWRNIFSPCSTGTIRFLGSAFGYTDGSLGTILGATLLEGYVVFFDRGAPSRIGFAPGQNCTELAVSEVSAADIDVLAGIGDCWAGAACSLRPSWLFVGVITSLFIALISVTGLVL
jgi:hypothetical protein